MVGRIWRVKKENNGQEKVGEKQLELQNRDWEQKMKWTLTHDIDLIQMMKRRETDPPHQDF